MKLIVGLGNPGVEYKNTRHNIGFMFIDSLARKLSTTVEKKKFNGLYNEVMVFNEKVILLKPQSYINLSGEVIKKYVDYFKIEIDDILIISDDLDQSVGKYKLKSNGSSGGHNGLKNIELNLNTSHYKRLKIGISNNKNIDTKDYVLSNISKFDMDLINNIIDRSLEIVEDFIKINFDKMQQKYNSR